VKAAAADRAARTRYAEQVAVQVEASRIQPFSFQIILCATPASHAARPMPPGASPYAMVPMITTPPRRTDSVFRRRRHTDVSAAATPRARSRSSMFAGKTDIDSLAFAPRESLPRRCCRCRQWQQRQRHAVYVCIFAASMPRQNAYYAAAFEAPASRHALRAQAQHRSPPRATAESAGARARPRQPACRLLRHQHRVQRVHRESRLIRQNSGRASPAAEEGRKIAARQAEGSSRC